MRKKTRDIMTARPESVSIDETLEDAARKLAKSPAGAVAVLDDDNRLQGIVTDHDVVLAMAAGFDPASTEMGDIAEGTAIVAVTPDDSLDDAARTMERTKVRRVPVVDGAQVVGMLTYADLAKSLPKRSAARLVRTSGP